MAKLARYEYNKKIYEGLVDADEIHVIKGSFWEHYEVSAKKHRISEVRLLPPVIPTKIVCVGQNYLGDIVITGTPRGIAPMKSGDTVEVEIEGIGTLRNKVQAEGQSSQTS